MKSIAQVVLESGRGKWSTSSASPTHHRKRQCLITILGCSLVLLASPVFAQVAPDLGVAGQFGALGNSGVTGSTTAGTVVTGDVGSYPTPTISNFPPSSTVAPYIVHFAADGVVQQARADANAAYTALTQGPGTALADNLATVGALTPGIYSVNAPNLPSGTSLTLNDPTGTGVFIFNVGSSLTANINSSVIGNANPCNVYWQVGVSATLNGDVFWGTVLADASITVGDGANLVGRALAGTGATGLVTMAGDDGNTISGCVSSTPLVVGPVAPTVIKSFNPVMISVDGISTLTITLFNSSVDTPDAITSLTDNLSADLLVAPVPNAGNTCGGAVTALPGSGSIVLTGGTIPAASLANNLPGSCTVTVDVASSVVGVYVNTVEVGGLITASGTNAEPAIATLNVVVGGVTDIPTLSEWAMMVLVALLLLVGGLAMRGRTR